MLTQEFVKSRFYYDDGRLYHKKRAITNYKIKTWNTRFADLECNTLNQNGYFSTNLWYLGERRRIPIHRLIFLMFHGYLPFITDHIDGNKTNNKIENLRDVGHQENQRNLRLRENSSSGFTGVSWHKASGKWTAQVSVCREVIYLGVFADINDAITARKEANVKYGFHVNHGSKAIV